MIDRKYIKGAARSMIRGRWFRLLAGFIPSLAVAIVTIVILLSFIFGILIMCQSELHKLLKNGFASKLLAK